MDIPKKLVNLGYVQYRPGAEYHINNPQMSKMLHKAVRSQDQLFYDKYKYFELALYLIEGFYH